VRFNRALYLAGPDMLLRVISTARAPVVMVVAHNPGIGELAAQFAPMRPDHTGFGRYPTGATTVLEFDATDWTKLPRQAARVLDFIVPRDLDKP
jgi:phosphohistidine phosphatase